MRLSGVGLGPGPGAIGAGAGPAKAFENPLTTPTTSRISCSLKIPRKLGHAARVETVGHDSDEIAVARRRALGRRLVLEQPLGEVARARDHRWRGGTVAAPVRPVLDIETLS